MKTSIQDIAPLIGHTPLLAIDYVFNGIEGTMRQIRVLDLCVRVRRISSVQQWHLRQLSNAIALSNHLI